MGVKTHIWAWRSYLVFFLAPLLFSPLIVALESKESQCAYVILLMAVYWISECLPVGVTALLPVVLFPYFQIMGTEEVATEYMNNLNMLFIGGLMVAIAIEYWNIHKRIALRVLTLMGSELRWVMLGMMVSTWFLSMWISNTASTAMMVPITEAILEELRKSGKEDDLMAPHAHFQDVQLETNTPDVHRPHTNRKSQEITNSSPVQSSKDDDKDPQVKVVLPEPKNGDDSPSRASPGHPQRQDDPHFTRMAKGMLLSICYAANCGGIASLTGTGPNLVLKRQVDKLYESKGLDSPITFISWMYLGLPLSAAMLIICWCWLQILFFSFRTTCCKKQSQGEQERKMRVARVIREQYDALGPMVCGQIMVIILFVCMVILWFTRDLGGVSGWGKSFEMPVKDGTSAVLVCILVFALPSSIPFLKTYPHDASHPETDGVYGLKEGRDNTQLDGELNIRPLLRWKFAVRRFPWALVLLLGGGFAISSGCQKSGLSPWIGNQLTYFQGWNEYAILFIVCFICTTTTEFASNAAMAAIMMPILQRLALSTHVHPLLYMLPACFACSFAYMLPVATPPNALVFSSGRLRITDMMKAGIVLNIIAVPVMIGIFESLGRAVFDLDYIPQPFLNMTSS